MNKQDISLTNDEITFFLQKYAQLVKPDEPHYLNIKHENCCIAS